MTCSTQRGLAALATHSQPQAIQFEIDHGRRIKRDQLTQEQAADDGDAERTPKFRTCARPKGQRQSAEQRRHGGHQNWTEAQHASFKNGVSRVLALFALRHEREIDHHYGVLLDDPDEQHDADDRNHI